MIIEPMDDFWKQMLYELENTTDEEWTQLFEDYEREMKPMIETTDLCNKVLDLVDAINHEQLIRLCDISLVIEKDTLDCYGDTLSITLVNIYKGEELLACIDLPAYGDTRFIVYVKIIEKQPFLRHIIELLETRVQLQGEKHE